MDAKQVNNPRVIERVIRGQPTSDGAGVKLTRVLTQDLQQRLDPFLMLDHFASENPGDYIGGFPDHPHRGFETVTYMLAGRMRHRDSAGHEGLLQGGGVQWMTAGRGLVHSEMPEQEEGLMEGFQLWLNLPSGNKMCPPWYRDIQSPEIPELTTNEGVRVRVIAGCSHGLAGAVQRDEHLATDQPAPVALDPLCRVRPTDHCRGGRTAEATFPFTSLEGERPRVGYRDRRGMPQVKRCGVLGKQPGIGVAPVDHGAQRPSYRYILGPEARDPVDVTGQDRVVLVFACRAYRGCLDAFGWCSGGARSEARARTKCRDCHQHQRWQRPPPQAGIEVHD